MINQNRVPHIYHGTKYSIKLFEMIQEKHKRIRAVYQFLGIFNDIDACYGYLLDLHGQNCGVFREGKTDEEYRRVLKFEMASTRLMGSPEEIKILLARYFGLSESMVSLSEGSAKIYLRVPEGTDVEEVKRRIQLIKGAGVGYVVDIEIYIEDFTVAELAEKTVEEIAQITIARR